jgi:hypothetical protein
MNQHYDNAVAAMREMDELNQRGAPLTEVGAIGAMQTRAVLAVAEEQAKTNQHLELANLIAYAHLRREQRRPSLATEELVAGRMSAFPEIKDELAEDEDDL